MNRRGFLQGVSAMTFAFHVVPSHLLGRGFTPPQRKAEHRRDRRRRPGGRRDPRYGN
jgi:hypothetical protein